MNSTHLYQIKVHQPVCPAGMILGYRLTSSGGAKPASGYTLQLTNPLNSTGTSPPHSVTMLTNRYLRSFGTVRDQTGQLAIPLPRRHNQRFNLRLQLRIRFQRPLISVFNCG